MARVNDQDVKDIIETELETLTPFITPANILVTKTLDGLLDDTHLKEIERWLAAHFVAIRDPRTTKSKIGDAEETYALGPINVIGSGSVKDNSSLNDTPYGRQVILLDTTGLLSAELNKKKASFEVLG